MTEKSPIPAPEAQSESLSAAIFDALPTHLAVLDTAGRIIAVNRAWRRFAAENGLPESQQDWLGINYLAVCEAARADPDAQAALAGIRAVLAGAKKNFSLEYPCHAPHQPRWFQMHVSPLFLPLAGVLIAHENISERKQTEQQLHLDEARLNALLDLSETAFQLDEKAVIDLSLEKAVRLTGSQIGYFHFVNQDQQSIRLFTWSRETLKYCDIAYAEHYPLDQAGVWADCARMRRPVVHNDYQNLPNRKGYPAGHAHLVRHLSVPVIDQHRVTLIMGVGNKASYYEESDVRQLQIIANEVWRIVRRQQAEAELRQTLERYHHLFMGTPVVGLLIDPENGAIVDANRRALKYYGCRYDQITRLKITDINTLPCDQIIQEMQRAREQRRDYFLFQHRLASGEIRDVEVYSGPVDIQGQRLLHSIIRDITDRKRMEAERSALQQQLLEMSRQAGMAEIATGVLHNVGNVLNSVNVSVSLLGERLQTLRIAQMGAAVNALRDALAGSAPRLLDYLESLAAHFGDEQQQLLDELRGLRDHIDHIKWIVNCQQNYASSSGFNQPTVLTRLLDDALAMNIADRHAIEILRDYAPLPPIITDRHKLLQIVVNLVRNAKEALLRHREGSAQRQLRVRLERQDEQPLRIEISDNGVGIAPEHLAQVFAFGFTTKPEGHGFGLHASANLARELGGYLHCQSNGLNQGATFILELPFTPVPSSHESERPYP